MTEKKNAHYPKIFGTDGVRGRANTPPLTVETALSLGRAAGKIFRRTHNQSRIVIGKDTRLSCYMYENALIAGLCSMGVDTLMVGPLPTPGVAFITRAYRANAGVVISASHNPFYDNGIKFFSADGYKLPDSWEEEMEKLVAENHFEDFLPGDAQIGRNFKIIDADGRYIEFVKATFPKKLSLKNLTIALDCANGAGYKVAPLVFSELDAKVHVYGNTPNGLNINEGCGSLHPELIQKAVIEHHADVGIALDGDADRVLMIDENAQIVNGDLILAICAQDMKHRGQLRNNRAVATVMTNLGVIHAMQNEGIEVSQAPVGDRYVIEQMLQMDAALGGEQSGHLIFLEHNTTGDGLVAALQVLRIMIERGVRLSELTAHIKKYPQVCLNIPVLKKPPLETLSRVQEAKQKAEEQLKEHGRVLLRYSGTENICRIMIEGKDFREVSHLAKNIGRLVEEEIGTPAQRAVWHR